MEIPEAAALIYSGQAVAIKVTELDFDKSAIQLELEGGSGSPDNGSSYFGPYASEEDAALDYERARQYYAARARDYAAKYGEGQLDWRVELVPWRVPRHQTFSAYIAGQEARAQGIRPEDVDLRAVFGEPVEIAAPGRPFRPSALAEPLRQRDADGTVVWEGYPPDEGDLDAGGGAAGPELS